MKKTEPELGRSEGGGSLSWGIQRLTSLVGGLRPIHHIRDKIEVMNNPLRRLKRDIERIKKMVEPVIPYYLEAYGPNRTLADIKLDVRAHDESDVGTEADFRLNHEAYLSKAAQALPEVLFGYMNNEKLPQSARVEEVYSYVKDRWDTTKVADFPQLFNAVIERLEGIIRIERSWLSLAIPIVLVEDSVFLEAFEDLIVLVA